MTTTAPRGKRERTKAQNRAAILDAARDVFVELGFDGASVRDIVRRTDLAAGTFYNYFPDKDAVFRALVDESVGELRMRLRAVRGGATTLEGFVGDAFRVLFTFIVEDRSMFDLLHRNAGTVRTMFDEPTLGLAVQDLLEDLDAAIARGDLPAVDTGFMAAAMSGAGFEVAVRMVEREPLDVERAVAFATDLFLGGIGRMARRGATA
jgi:AcrR family transcriptional regulator